MLINKNETSKPFYVGYCIELGSCCTYECRGKRIKPVTGRRVSSLEKTGEKKNVNSRDELHKKKRGRNEQRKEKKLNWNKQSGNIDN
jgi:hypothetical protein